MAAPAVVISILQFLGLMAKEGMKFAKWLVAHVRTAWLQIVVLWEWYLRLTRNSIVLRVLSWGLWTAAIESAMVGLTHITLTPLVSNFVSSAMPQDGSALLYLFWEHGIRLELAFECAMAYIALWLLLHRAIRLAHATARYFKASQRDPTAYFR